MHQLELELLTNRSNPSGASDDSDLSERDTCNPSCVHSLEYKEKLKRLEEEHELLNSSLCALTTHFAQVQFRLRQTVSAPASEQETLLKSLEEFAFAGIPDVGIVRDRLDGAKFRETVWFRRLQQQQLLEKLKKLINEFENVSKNETDIQKYEMKEKVVVKPCNRKEELIEQLKIQLEDLEHFVGYLQNGRQKCMCSIEKQEYRESFISRTNTFFHLLAMFYLSWQKERKKTTDHWGSLRARLEISIGKLLEAMTTDKSGLYVSDDESSSSVQNIEVTTLVRKHLSVSIRDLMQHGTTTEGPSQCPLMLFCFKKRGTPVHAWEIVLKYYQMKGKTHNSSPARMLSESFDLDIAGAKTSNLNSMLREIGHIISTHSSYKRSYDSQFKAFISAGLNENKLAAWLGLIYQCKSLLQTLYQPWSYAMETKFNDSLKSLDVLTPLKFDLPVDLAVYRFKKVEDAFT